MNGSRPDGGDRTAGARHASSWRSKAACRHEDPDLFFPVGEAGPAALRQIEAARAVCRRCPVIGACRDWAVAQGVLCGVWGGLTENERRTIARRSGRSGR